MVQWAFSATLNIPEESVTVRTYLYMSGETFFTLGLGDVTPVSSLGERDGNRSWTGIWLSR